MVETYYGYLQSIRTWWSHVFFYFILFFLWHAANILPHFLTTPTGLRSSKDEFLCLYHQSKSQPCLYVCFDNPQGSFFFEGTAVMPFWIFYEAPNGKEESLIKIRFNECSGEFIIQILRDPISLPYVTNNLLIFLYILGYILLALLNESIPVLTQSIHPPIYCNTIN